MAVLRNAGSPAPGMAGLLSGSQWSGRRKRRIVGPCVRRVVVCPLVPYTGGPLGIDRESERPPGGSLAALIFPYGKVYPDPEGRGR